MNKVLLLIDPANFRPSVLSFVSSVIETGRSKVIGVFLHHPAHATAPQIKSLGGQVYVEEITQSAEELEQSKEELRKAIGAFKCDCLALGLKFDVHNDVRMSEHEIVAESRYADLIVADCNLTAFSSDKSPSRLLTGLLKHSECPVIIAPEEYRPVEKVVFAYDGSASSMFAIRQLYRCLPHLAGKELVVLNVDNGKDKTPDAHELKLLDEWLKLKVRHYAFEKYDGAADSVMFSYFLSGTDQVYSLLVAGAFGRSAVSSFMKSPTLEMPLKALDIPVFITHL